MLGAGCGLGLWLGGCDLEGELIIPPHPWGTLMVGLENERIRFACVRQEEKDEGCIRIRISLLLPWNPSKYLREMGSMT